MMYSIRFALLFLLVFSFFSGFAQNNLLTIQHAVDSAMNNNAELNQLNAQLQKIENQWRLETGISPPEISYFKEGIQNDPVSPFAEKRISVTQEIDFPLTTIYRLKGLKEEVLAKQFQIETKKNEIKAEVKKNYIEVLYALHLQKSLQEQLKLATDLYNAVFSKFESGMGNGIDLTNAELQLEQVKNDLDQAEWILHQARYGLFYTMGLAVEKQKYSIEFSDTLQAVQIDISQIQALAVQENQPNYISTLHRLKASNYFLKEAKSNLLPDINFSLYKQDYGQGYNFKGFEVGLKIPLWLPLEQKGKIKIAQADLSEIQWQQNEIKLDMKKQIEYAWHNYSVSRNIINRYNTSLKIQSHELLRMSLKAYQLGEIDLLNLLNAQQTHIRSQQRYIVALRDYYIQLVDLEKFLDKELVY